MTDAGRQSATDKATSAIKPESEKGILEKGKEGLDSVASSVQPESGKSNTQQATDSVSGNSNENSGSLMDKAKDAVGMNK